MNEIATGFTVGLVVGLVFFGGLWLTVRCLVRSRHPGLLMLLSVCVRGTAVVAAAGFVVRYGVAGLVSFLVGVIVVRTALMHKWGFSNEDILPFGPRGS